MTLCLGLAITQIDATVVNVALPSIQRDLDLPVSTLAWVVNGYALTFAVLMLSGGKLADRFGRRRLLIVGLSVFTVASLACGFAWSGEVLIASRLVQGVGSAMLMPATLATIAATFPPEQRGAAIGVWTGVSAAASCSGPAIGGVIADGLSWHWVFFVNVPIGLVAIVAARLLVQESRDPAPGRLDVPGLLAAGVAICALVLALIEANERGWTSPWILGLFALAAVALACFVLLESHRRTPMLDVSLFANRAFAGATIALLTLALSNWGMWFFVSLYLQNVLEYTPSQAGVAFIPCTIIIVAIAPVAGRLADRIGSRWLCAAGLSVISASMVHVSLLGADATYLELVLALMPIGAGIALTVTPAMTAALAVVPVSKSGVGSSVLHTTRQLGGALGLAALGAIMAGYVTAPSGTALWVDQYVEGMHHTLQASAVFALLGALVAATTLRRPKPREATGERDVVRTAAAVQHGTSSPTAGIPTSECPAD